MTKYFATKIGGFYIGGFDVPDSALETELNKQKFALADVVEVPSAPEHAVQIWNGVAWSAKPANQAAIDAAKPAWIAGVEAAKKKLP